MVGDEVVEEEDVAPALPVVEISRNSRNDYQGLTASDEEEYEDDNLTDEEQGDDFYDGGLSSPRRRASPLPQPRYKSVNGKKRINMTPPDQKLLHSQDMAKRLAKDGKVDRAIEEHVKCVAYSRIVHGETHWKHVQEMANLAEAYMDLKGYAAQSEYHASNAKALMMVGSSTVSSLEEKADIFAVLIKIYQVDGVAKTMLKNYGQAEQALQKADRIAQERSKLSCVTDRECDRVDIKLFQAMARLYAKQKKYALATERYEKVIDLMEKEFGVDSPQAMQMYTELGKLELSKGRYANSEKAIQMFLQAHSIASAIHKDGHPELIDTSLALANAYASTGREEAEGSAVSYLEESLNTCTTLHGTNHPKTLEVRDHLAKMFIRIDRNSEALEILRSSLPSKCEAFGDYSEPVSDTYKLMGGIHLSEGNIEKALRVYKKCHTIETCVLGKGHSKTKDTLRTMEMLMANPSVSNKFVLNSEDKLQKRPRFNSVVGRTK